MIYEFSSRVVYGNTMKGALKGVRKEKVATAFLKKSICLIIACSMKAKYYQGNVYAFLKGMQLAIRVWQQKGHEIAVKRQLVACRTLRVGSNAV